MISDTDITLDGEIAERNRTRTRENARQLRANFLNNLGKKS